jgi:hypothetical protein
MQITYVIDADSALRAQDIARSRALADGWTQVSGVFTTALGVRTYEVRMIVSGGR